MNTVIGFIGKRGCGKDTAAAHLIEKHGFKRLAFADALYQEVSGHYGVPIEFLQARETKEQPNLVLDGRPVLSSKSPRQALQDWGMLRRETDPLYWIKKVTDKIRSEPGKYIVTDVRFKNELNAIRDLKGLVIRIRRPAWEANIGSVGTDQHTSETELDGVAADFLLNNRENALNLLHSELDEALLSLNAA